ncbi:phage head closure protein [Gymnodinialimonas hymeniacidonis]|uniref:phage head closure protein n=1 Tax=Gymnodinialimonas hymeniacidonis TaxID=3126508 RepID=UPI0034C6A449
MRPPQFNRKLILEAPSRVSDGAGGFAETWAPLGIIWGEVLPRGAGREVEASELKLKVTVRAAPQGAPSRPTAAMRFRDGDRIYRIEAVTEAEAEGRYLICFVKEEVGA